MASSIRLPKGGYERGIGDQYRVSVELFHPKHGMRYAQRYFYNVHEAVDYAMKAYRHTKGRAVVYVIDFHGSVIRRFTPGETPIPPKDWLAHPGWAAKKNPWPPQYQVMGKKYEHCLEGVGPGYSPYAACGATFSKRYGKRFGEMLSARRRMARRNPGEDIYIPESLARDLSQWHSGMDATYAVSSSAYAGRPVPKEIVIKALGLMEQNALIEETHAEEYRRQGQTRWAKEHLRNYRHAKRTIKKLERLLAEHGTRSNPRKTSAGFVIESSDDGGNYWSVWKRFDTKPEARIALEKLRMRLAAQGEGVGLKWRVREMSSYEPDFG